MRMKLILLIFVVAGFTTARAKSSSCVDCHLSSDWVSDTTIVSDYMSGDIHFKMGLSCDDCHGGDPKRGFEEGDPDLAMDPLKGYKAPPSRTATPDFCDRCHSDIEYMKRYNPRLPTDQLKLYKTSVHGKQLYRTRDTKVAVCTDCHGVHNILPSSDSRSMIYHNNVPETCRKCHGSPQYMRGYKYNGRQIPTDQYEEYSKSVHGIMVLEEGDNSAPSCNNCHGNHGATPPNLISVSAACGECHAYNRDFFNASVHKEVWEDLGYPECEQCHGNHLIQPATEGLLGVDEGALCIQCHDEGDDGYAAASIMKAQIDSLKHALESAEKVAKEAEEKGVEGGQARFDLGAAKDNLTRVRSVIHTFDPEQVSEITSSGIKVAHEVEEIAELALGDIKIRQIGLAISLLVILYVALILWRKIKQVDSKTDFVVRDK
ncbi:MAG: cytochrome c3 family protein [candidate division Zixibacteria bacterium]